MEHSQRNGGWKSISKRWLGIRLGIRDHIRMSLMYSTIFTRQEISILISQSSTLSIKVLTILHAIIMQIHPSLIELWDNHLILKLSLQSIIKTLLKPKEIKHPLKLKG
jgi:hypothetical protein